MRALSGSAQWDVKVDKKESCSNPQLPQPVLYDYFKPSTLLSPALVSHDLVAGLLIFPVLPQKLLSSVTDMAVAASMLCQYVMNIESEVPSLLFINNAEVMHLALACSWNEPPDLTIKRGLNLPSETGGKDSKTKII